MSQRKAVDKALSTWANAYKAENLGIFVCALIHQANWDLYNGPCQDEDWPGFTTACKKIREALDDLPSMLYVDSDTGEVTETEPPEDECVYGYWYKVDKDEILNELVGKELKSYL